MREGLCRVVSVDFETDTFTLKNIDPTKIQDLDSIFIYSGTTRGPQPEGYLRPGETKDLHWKDLKQKKRLALYNELSTFSDIGPF